MSAIKCTACGLVNFATAIACKRCQQPLQQTAATVNAGGYQPATSYRQNSQPSYPPPQFASAAQPLFAHEMPPPPPVFDGQLPVHQVAAPPMNCVKCGGADRTGIFTYKKDYIPPWCYLGLLAGLLPLAILVSIFRLRHTINAPFCSECWSSFKKAKVVETLSTLSILPFVFFGAILGVALNSSLVFFVFLLGFAATAVYGQMYKKKHFPKYAQIDSKVVMIDTPIFGPRNFSAEQKMAL